MQVLQETFAAGPQEIEDLWLPFFCVSTNLSRAQVQVHQLGRLWQFVRASMTIVGMIPPVFSNGDMLVDGGYLNNQPVDVMHSLGVRTVLVVCTRSMYVLAAPLAVGASDAPSSRPDAPVLRPVSAALLFVPNCASSLGHHGGCCWA